MVKEDVTINELMEFLQENMTTKEDLSVLDKRMDGMEKRMDGMDKRMENGFAEILGRLDRIEADLDEVKSRLARLEQKVQEEGTMYAGEVVDLRKRVSILEQQVKQMQAEA
jgi:predicted nuclease with TOPRIM domain